MTARFTSRLCPIYINCRDRVESLRALVDWLERAGHERIVLLDNDSTYPPLLAFYESTPHQVVRLRRNSGSRALWNENLVPAEPFVYTDPDIVPCDDCPLDAVAHFYELQQRYRVPKAGFGLYLDDVPESISALSWERQLASPVNARGPGVFESPIDTTFAVYEPACEFTHTAVRTGAPYLARHTSWYRETELDAEDRYYLERAISGPLGSSWKQRRELEGA